MRKYDFWPVQCFLNGQKWGVKNKSFLYVHFEGLTTDLFSYVRWKKRLFNTLLLMGKYDFWPVQCFLNGQKWGIKKKSFLLCPFWRFDNTLIFWPPGRRSYREKGFLTLFWWENIDFWPVQCFLNGQKWGVKKQKLLSMSILKVWQLTLILAKQDPLGGGHIEKKAFLTLFWWENI